MSAFDPFQTGPLYDLHRARWQLELDVSEWTLDVLHSGAYLDRFSDREHPDDYDYRRRMACPMDMCRDGVRIRVDNLWRTPPKREIRPGPFEPVLRRLLHDADGQGASLDAFMRGACWDMYVTGVDVVTQVSGADGRSLRTLADQANADVRPYFLRFSPLRRYDWATNGAGAFLWARYCLGAEPTVDEMDGDAEACVQFLTVSADGWRLWRAVESDGESEGRSVELLDEGELKLATAPIVKLYFAESRKAGCGGVPLSLLTRPAVVARVALNLKSQADADLLAAVTRWMLSGVGADELPDAYAPGVVWKLPNADARLQIAQGDVAHIAEKRQWLTLYLAEILRLLKFRGGMAELAATNGSGVRLALERTDLDNELRATASQLEAAELEMMRQAVSLLTAREIPREHAGEMLGYSVVYNRDYVLEPVGEMLDNLRTWLGGASVAGETPEIGREMLRQLGNMLAREGSESHRRMMAQIERASFAVSSTQTPGTAMAE